MVNVRKVIKLVCLALCTTALASCGPQKGDDVVIGKKTMSKIISDIYLADQYIKHTPKYEAEADTMYVYPAIVEKYGYKIDDYWKSVKYYLQDHDEYSKILKQARAILDKRFDELEALVAKQEGERRIRLERWWGLDSTRKADPLELRHDRLLRSIRWMVIPNEKLVKWSMADSAQVDIPQNPFWWATTANPPQRKFHTFMVKKSEEIEEDEKNSSQLRPDKLRSINQKRIRKVR